MTSLFLCRCFSSIQPITDCYFFQPSSTFWAVLKSVTMEFAFRSSRVTRAALLGMLRREGLFGNTNVASLEGRFFKASGFRIGYSFLPAIYQDVTAPPTHPTATLSPFYLCAQFWSQPSLGCPGQSRDHTLLPKRPRMPATGFIDSDWTDCWKR